MSTKTKKTVRKFRVRIDGIEAKITRDFDSRGTIIAARYGGSSADPAVFKTEISAMAHIQHTLEAAEKAREPMFPDFAKWTPLYDAVKTMPQVEPFIVEEGL